MSAPELASASALLPPERHLRLGLRVLAVTFVVEIAAYAHYAWSGPVAARPFAVNSIAKDVLFAVLALLAASDVRRFRRLVWLLVVAHAAIVAVLAVLWAFGHTDSVFPHLPLVGDAWRLPLWLTGALLVTLGLAILAARAGRARYALAFLSPVEFETLAALAEVTLERPLLTPAEIARRVDGYWGAFDAPDKGRLKITLWLLCLLPLPFRAPLALMAPDARRRFVEKRLLRDLTAWHLLRPLRRVLRAALRFATQMVYLGYYSDERSYPPTGFARFTKRARFGRIDTSRPPRPELETTPANGDRLSAEVVIVGTGAAGGVLAHCLVARGKDVLMLERGRHVPSSTFTEDEAEMYTKLYSAGAMQLSRDFSFQVLQGMCVGGSTVVNNGVCFDLPRSELERWNGPGLRAGLPDWAGLAPSFDAVRRMTGVTRQDRAPSNPGGRMLVAAVEALGLAGSADQVGTVAANLEGCVGCGYCNTGCAYGRKLSMLDWLLPRTQEAARRTGKGRLRIVPECEATAILHDGRRATGVRCHANGGGPGALTVGAEEVVIAAGALHSSRLLQNSGLGGEGAGAHLCANIATHLTAEWPRSLDAFDGLQMSHFFEEGQFAIEDWLTR